MRLRRPAPSPILAQMHSEPLRLDDPRGQDLSFRESIDSMKSYLARERDLNARAAGVSLASESRRVARGRAPRMGAQSPPYGACLRQAVTPCPRARRPPSGEPPCSPGPFARPLRGCVPRAPYRCRGGPPARPCNAASAPSSVALSRTGLRPSLGFKSSRPRPSFEESSREKPLVVGARDPDLVSSGARGLARVGVRSLRPKLP